MGWCVKIIVGASLLYFGVHIAVAFIEGFA